MPPGRLDAQADTVSQARALARSIRSKGTYSPVRLRRRREGLRGRGAPVEAQLGHIGATSRQGRTQPPQDASEASSRAQVVRVRRLRSMKDTGNTRSSHVAWQNCTKDARRHAIALTELPPSMTCLANVQLQISSNYRPTFSAGGL